MTELTAAMLRQYGLQVDQQIDEYADRMDDLEDENARLKDQVEELEDQVRDLTAALDRAEVPA